MDKAAGEDDVDLEEKKEAYRDEAEEEAEEDHLSPAYATVQKYCRPSRTARQVEETAY